VAESEKGFESALELAKRERAAGPPAVVEGVLVKSEVDLEGSRQIWIQADVIRDALFQSLACYDEIDGHKELNRTGLMRLALPFGLSIEGKSFDEDNQRDMDSGEYDHRYRFQIRVSKGSRSVDGIGSCRLSEISAKTKKGEDVPIGKREHLAISKAWTRAAKRAISDMLGGNEAY